MTDLLNTNVLSAIPCVYCRAAIPAESFQVLTPSERVLSAPGRSHPVSTAAELSRHVPCGGDHDDMRPIRAG
jgi:hypothetical protein